MPDDQYITASCVISNQVVYRNNEPFFAQKEPDVAAFLLALYDRLKVKYPKFYKMDPLSKLGWLAAEILLQDLQQDKYAPFDVGITLANANSSLDTDIRYFETARSLASPALFVYTLPNIMIGEICIRHNFKGENAFFIFDTFNSVFIRQYVNNLFNNNILQACICGWVELLEDQYKAALFLVEKNKTGLSTLFTVENINKIYQLEDG